MLFDVLVAPVAQVCINDRTRPIVAVGLQVAWMEMKVAVFAMFGNDAWD